LAEYVGHKTPDGLQRLLVSCRWEPDKVRDDPKHYIAQTLGRPEGVLIVDDTGFVEKAPRRPGSSGSTPAPRAERFFELGRGMSPACGVAVATCPTCATGNR